MDIYFLKSDTTQYVIYPVPQNKEDYHVIAVEDENELVDRTLIEQDGQWVLVASLPDIASQQVKMREAINHKRNKCVNGGVYVAAIDKWIDTDDAARANLVEIKADFDLNGKDGTYTFICADNTAKDITFSEFKAIWDAVKSLKERMFENAYMHQVLMMAEDDPLTYDYSSVGWAHTYQDYLMEQNNEKN